MAEANFRVIITGEVASDFNYSEVVNTAARLFKCTPAQAQKLLGNQPTTLKRVMDKQTALRYCQQLLKAGIICRVENDSMQTSAPDIGKVDVKRAIPQDSVTGTVSLANLAAEKPILQPAPSATMAQPHINAVRSAPKQNLSHSNLSLEPIAPEPVPDEAESNQAQAAPLRKNQAPSPLSLQVVAEASRQPEPSAVFEPTATHEIICPKCKNVQRIASECSHCGIVFSKFVGDKRLAQEQQEQENPVAEAKAQEWDEMSWFIGENFESYRDKFVAIANNNDKFVPQWHWPAFLVPYAWFIHRKLYVYYGIYLAYFVLMIFLGVAPFVSALMANTVCALSANYIYYRHAKRKIAMCDDDIDARRIDIIEAGETNSIIVTLGATLGLILLTWVLIFNFMVRPVVNALLDSLEQDQAFVDKGSKEEKPTRAAMVMLKNVVIGTKIAKNVTGEHFDIPNDMDELRDALKLEPAAADLQFKDSWGKAMHYYGDNQHIRIESAGPDSKWNSDDDIVLESRVPQKE